MSGELNRVANRKWKRLRPGTRLYREVRPSWIERETGRTGVTTRYGRSRSAVESRGERVHAVRWGDTGLVTLTHCRGDNKRTEYIEWERGIFDMDDMAVEAWALERLTNRDPVVAWCARCGRPMQDGDLMCCPGEKVAS